MWLKLRVFFQDHASSFRTIILGFALLILTGAVLLSLPYASADGVPVSFLDALFTSTSASCVTGLVLFDTYTQWSLFGRIIILILIQIGGLGVVTMIIVTLVLTGKRIGIMSRLTMQDAVSAHQTGGIIRFTLFFLTGTFLMEGIGAILLCPAFIRDFGAAKGIGFAVFHSISAFCNAGFDLMGVKTPFASLTMYSGSVLVNLVIAMLIITGGIGFATWRDLLDARFHFRRLRLQSKIILSTSAILIVLPFIFFWFFEFSAFSGKERFLLSLFQTVTPRTAGFSTFDYGKMSESGQLFTIILMMTGGAPGSTAGGMKVTTLAAVILCARAGLRRNSDITCWRRRIEEDTVRSAVTIMTVYILQLLAGSVILSIYEQLPLLPCMFECASALGTVGLTTGITPGLHTLSKLVLTGFMFFGRVGGLTIAYAMVAGRMPLNRRYPAEKLTVG